MQLSGPKVPSNCVWVGGEEKLPFCRVYCIFQVINEQTSKKLIDAQRHLICSGGESTRQCLCCFVLRRRGGMSNRY